MRKRQARSAGNPEDMWFTMPRKEAPADAEGAEVAPRSDQPTYEDTWYQILRGPDEDHEGAESHDEDADGTDADAPAEPQHASSLD